MVNCPEAEAPDCYVDNIKATPSGEYVAVGFPKIGRVVFLKVDVKENTAKAIEPRINIEFDQFESDDCMTVLLFNNKRTLTLKLYAIRWIFDTSKID